MSTLLHWSDPHFGTERPEVMAALLRFSHEQKPELAILSGDITQRALDVQFGAARDFVDHLALPTVLIPGNHDIPLFHFMERAFRPYARYCRAFGPELEPVYASERFLVVAVNTTRRFRHTRGTVSLRQVERVAERLRRAEPGQLRIVVTHQPISVTRRQDERNMLIGGAAAVRQWADAGADLILGGHIHLPFIQRLSDRYPGLARQIWVVQAGTALSTRIRHEAGNSVNLIHAPKHRPRHCLVERWDYREGVNAFRLVSSMELDFSAERSVP